MARSPAPLPRTGCHLGRPGWWNGDDCTPVRPRLSAPCLPAAAVLGRVRCGSCRARATCPFALLPLNLRGAHHPPAPMLAGPCGLFGFGGESMDRSVVVGLVSVLLVGGAFHTQRRARCQHDQEGRPALARVILLTQSLRPRPDAEAGGRPGCWQQLAATPRLADGWSLDQGRGGCALPPQTVRRKLRGRGSRVELDDVTKVGRSNKTKRGLGCWCWGVAPLPGQPTT